MRCWLTRPRELIEWLGREQLIDPRPVIPLESVSGSRKKRIKSGGGAASAAALAAQLQQQYLDLRESLLVAKAAIGANAPKPGGDLSSYLEVLRNDSAVPNVNLGCAVTTKAPAIPALMILWDALCLGYYSKSWPSLGNAVVRYDAGAQALARFPVHRDLLTALRVRLLVIVLCTVVLIGGPVQTFASGQLGAVLKSVPALLQLALMLLSLATYVLRDVLSREQRHEFNDCVGVEVGPLPSLMPLILRANKHQFMISYAWGSKYLGLVRQLSAMLPDCWLDANRLAPGDPIPTETVAAARHARVVIHFVTCEFVRSTNCVPEICTSIQHRRWPQLTIVFVDDETCNCREPGAPGGGCKFVRESLGAQVATLVRRADPCSVVVVRSVWQLLRFLDEHVLRVTDPNDVRTCVGWWQQHGQPQSHHSGTAVRVMPPRMRKRLWHLNKRISLLPCRRPGAVVASFRQLAGEGTSVSRFRFLTHHETTFALNAGIALLQLLNMGIYCVPAVYAAVLPMPGFGPEACDPSGSVFLWGFTMLPIVMSVVLVYFSPKLEPAQLHDPWLLPLVVAAYTCTHNAPSSSSGGGGGRGSIFASPLRPAWDVAPRRPGPVSTLAIRREQQQQQQQAGGSGAAASSGRSLATTVSPFSSSSGGSLAGGSSGGSFASSAEPAASSRSLVSVAGAARRPGPWAPVSRPSHLSISAPWQSGRPDLHAPHGGGDSDEEEEEPDNQEARELERVLGSFTVHFVTSARPAACTRDLLAGVGRFLQGDLPRRVEPAIGLAFTESTLPQLAAGGGVAVPMHLYVFCLDAPQDAIDWYDMMTALGAEGEAEGESAGVSSASSPAAPAGGDGGGAVRMGDEGKAGTGTGNLVAAAAAAFLKRGDAGKTRSGESKAPLAAVPESPRVSFSPRESLVGIRATGVAPDAAGSADDDDATVDFFGAAGVGDDHESETIAVVPVAESVSALLTAGGSRNGYAFASVSSVRESGTVPQRSALRPSQAKRAAAVADELWSADAADADASSPSTDHAPSQWPTPPPQQKPHQTTMFERARRHFPPEVCVLLVQQSLFVTQAVTVAVSGGAAETHPRPSSAAGGGSSSASSSASSSSSGLPDQVRLFLTQHLCLVRASGAGSKLGVDASSPYASLAHALLDSMARRVGSVIATATRITAAAVAAEQRAREELRARGSAASASVGSASVAGQARFKKLTTSLAGAAAAAGAVGAAARMRAAAALVVAANKARRSVTADAGSDATAGGGNSAGFFEGTSPPAGVDSRREESSTAAAAASVSVSMNSNSGGGGRGSLAVAPAPVAAARAALTAQSKRLMLSVGPQRYTSGISGSGGDSGVLPQARVVSRMFQP